MKQNKEYFIPLFLSFDLVGKWKQNGSEAYLCYLLYLWHFIYLLFLYFPINVLDVNFSPCFGGY